MPCVCSVCAVLVLCSCRVCAVFVPCVCCVFVCVPCLCCVCALFVLCECRVCAVFVLCSCCVCAVCVPCLCRVFVCLSVSLSVSVSVSACAFMCLCAFYWGSVHIQSADLDSTRSFQNYCSFKMLLWLIMIVCGLYCVCVSRLNLDIWVVQSLGILTPAFNCESVYIQSPDVDSISFI